MLPQGGLHLPGRETYQGHLPEYREEVQAEEALIRAMGARALGRPDDGLQPPDEELADGLCLGSGWLSRNDGRREGRQLPLCAFAVAA